MAELVLNNFASAIIHSAVFPEEPVRGVEDKIKFHLRPPAEANRLASSRPAGFPRGKLRSIPACRPGPNLPEERNQGTPVSRYLRHEFDAGISAASFRSVALLNML